jgi:hypothetical protein
VVLERLAVEFSAISSQHSAEDGVLIADGYTPNTSSFFRWRPPTGTGMPEETNRVTNSIPAPRYFEN